MGPAWVSRLGCTLSPVEPLRLHRRMWALFETPLRLLSEGSKFSALFCPSFQPERLHVPTLRVHLRFYVVRRMTLLK